MNITFHGILYFLYLFLDEEEVRVVSLNDIDHWFEGTKPFNILRNGMHTKKNELPTSLSFFLNI